MDGDVQNSGWNVFESVWKTMVLIQRLKHAGTARFAYNWGLEQKQAAQQANQKLPTAQALHKRLNALKASAFPWMYEVSKCAPQEALRNLDVAFKRFFKGSSGYPQAKKRSQGIGSFRLTGTILVGKKWVQLPVLGRVRVFERGYLPRGKHILSATVSERAGKWFVSLLVEEVFKDQAAPTGEPLGIDLGIKDLAVCSDETRYPNPQALKRHLVKLARGQRHFAKQDKLGKNHAKTKRKLARLHYRIACIREDALHKATTAIVAKTKPSCQRPRVVVSEDLNVKGMLKNRKLARAIADVGFGKFQTFLSYKTLWQHETLLWADRFYPSTQTCSACHRRRTVDLDLSQRTFVCEYENCGLVLDRDLNAACNLKHLAPPTASLAGRQTPDGQPVSPSLWERQAG
jgi:putative transposase